MDLVQTGGDLGLIEEGRVVVIDPGFFLLTGLPLRPEKFATAHQEPVFRQCPCYWKPLIS